MSDKPWLTDPKYGGMSKIAAQRSYEAWVRQGRRTLPVKKPPADDAVIARHKAIVEDLLVDYQRASEAYVAWGRDFKARQPKGFRGKRRDP